MANSRLPLGWKLLGKIWPNSEFSFQAYRTSVLILTFIAYALYHASRKPPSIVKNALSSDNDDLIYNNIAIIPYSWPLSVIYARNLPPNIAKDGLTSNDDVLAYNNRNLAPGFVYNDITLIPHDDELACNNITWVSFDSELASNNITLRPFSWPLSVIYIRKIPCGHVQDQRKQDLRKGWPPFDGHMGPSLLGEVDVAFLAAYAIAMFLAGHMGDRLCLRTFLSVGMVGSGICVMLFGLAYWWNIHWLYYFFMVQMMGGLFQASGWPSVVTIVGNWFGKSKRGLIMGVWNAHTSVGNIFGTLVASQVLRYGWGWSFLVPGVAIAVGGGVVFLFVVVTPEIAGFSSSYEEEEDNMPTVEWKEMSTDDVSEKRLQSPLLDNEFKLMREDESDGDRHAIAIGFVEAWAIPRVSSFAFCLFFSKLVAYTFLYWLPFYIRHTEIQGEYLSDATAGNLSTIFDIGGTLGGIFAGYLSDKFNARGIVAASFIYVSLPSLLLYRVYGGVTLWLNMGLLFLVGFFVNGPYALITTAVSADLGSHGSLKGNGRAMATVTAIIDGTGSIGAAIGPLLTGYLSKCGWNSVFAMLMLSATTAGLLLTSVVLEECKDYVSKLKLEKTRLRQIDLV